MKIQDLCEEKRQPGENHYLTPGRHIQLIGSQNGRFIAFGSHIFNEMGGIWMHPIKLLDGFWLGFKQPSGAIDWLTDASLYRNRAFYNELIFERSDYQLTRTEFSPQNEAGLIVKFDLKNLSQQKLNLNGVLTATTDIRPVWYSENAEIYDGKDLGHFVNTGLGDFSGLDFLAKDADNAWFTRLRLEGVEPTVSESPDSIGPDATFGKGTTGIWDFRLSVEAGATATFYFKIVGSLISEKQTLERVEALSDFAALFAEKEKVYQEILNHTDLSLADEALVKQFAWSKCHIEWLTVDSEPIGVGLAAGIPNYSWWFGVDSAYALKGCLPAGFHALAESTLAILREASRRANGDGRIIHEENSYGVVGNRGNTQETALFIHAVYQTYLWTGDKDWLRTYFYDVKKALSWLLIDMDRDQDLFPEGFGVIEGRDLTGEVIDTAVYTAVALANASEMASVFGDTARAEYYQHVSRDLTKKIQTEMWLADEGLFADVRAQSRDLMAVFDNAITQAESNGDDYLLEKYRRARSNLTALQDSDKDQIYTFKNWVIETPVEMRLATEEQAAQVLKRMNSEEFIGEWGSYLSGDGDSRIMTISSAVHINSLLAYGQADAALDNLKRVMKTFGLYLPGSYSEMSPDYGCFVQAWTAYATIGPLITGFLGLRPNAGKKEIRIRPCLPSDWDFLTVKSVKIGQEFFDFDLQRLTGGTYQVVVAGNLEGWSILTAENTKIK